MTTLPREVLQRLVDRQGDAFALRLVRELDEERQKCKELEQRLQELLAKLYKSDDAQLEA